MITHYDVFQINLFEITQENIFYLYTKYFVVIKQQI